MIYFDNASTTKISSEALVKLTEASSEIWGNPSSLHSEGVKAGKLIKDARGIILNSFGVRSITGNNLIFCGSGTEANNLALFGVAEAKNRTGRIIISDSEHSCIEESAKILEAKGFEIVRIPSKLGVLDFEFLKNALDFDDKKVVLVSIMSVNNETGAVYDIASVFSEVKRKFPDAVTHTDAVQGFLKININPKKIKADLVTVSAHKVHGPKGIGAVYADDSIIKAKKLLPVIYGGGQEFGFRSGTENVPAISAFGEAVRVGYSNMSVNIENTRTVKNHIIKRLYEAGAVRRDNTNLSDNSTDIVMLNLPPDDKSAPHILNITLPNIKSEVMLHYLSSEGICVSSGSACSSNSNKVSRSLTAFGLSKKSADCSLRLSFCESNTIDEADYFIEKLMNGIATLVKMR